MKAHAIQIITFVTCFAGINIFSTGLHGKDKPGSIIELEDEMIVKEIELDNNTIPDNGSIIIDDEFDDDLKEIRIQKKLQPKTGIRQLQNKDRRWHLTEYIIKKHDNLWQIAHRFKVSHKLIININNIKRPDILQPGKKLLIPNRNGIHYTVKTNDTVIQIARRYKVNKDTIISHNGINPRQIRPGQKLFIPDAQIIKTYKDPVRKEQNSVLTAGKAGKTGPLHRRFIWPLKNRITSQFGIRKDPFTGKRKFHCGIDIGANTGSSIKASAKGRVIFSGWKNGYGNVVILRHKKGYITVYAHNSKNLVTKGTTVKQGQVIAKSGSTGLTTGPHLHFEIRKYVTPLNPLRFLKKL